MNLKERPCRRPGADPAVAEAGRVMAFLGAVTPVQPEGDSEKLRSAAAILTEVSIKMLQAEGLKPDFAMRTAEIYRDAAGLVLTGDASARQCAINRATICLVTCARHVDIPTNSSTSGC